MKRFTSLAAAAVLAAAFAGSAVANEAFRGPLGVLANEPGVTEGYVLLTPQGSKTSYLINNDNTSASSKNKKAKELGIPILSEEDFLKMAQQ